LSFIRFYQPSSQFLWFWNVIHQQKYKCVVKDDRLKEWVPAYWDHKRVIFLSNAINLPIFNLKYYILSSKSSILGIYPTQIYIYEMTHTRTYSVAWLETGKSLNVNQEVIWVKCITKHPLNRLLCSH
jgi:hypothetical protein